jgi:hypothetical protein
VFPVFMAPRVLLAPPFWVGCAGLARTRGDMKPGVMLPKLGAAALVLLLLDISICLLDKETQLEIETTWKLALVGKGLEAE